MSDVSTDGMIDDLANDMSDLGDGNDFTSFTDVDVDDLSEEAPAEELKEEEGGSEDIDGDEEPKLDLAKKEVKEEVKSEESSEVKMISAKAGEDSVDINPNTTFTHKVDGKEVEVTMQELLNDYSGQKSWNGKFSELGEEKKTFLAEKQSYTTEKTQLVSKVDSFVDAVNKADAPKALEALAELSGGNPVELRKHFIDLMRDQALAYVNLTPEQQKELDSQVESKYHQERSQHLEAQLNANTEQTELTNQINSMQRQYGISDERLVELHDELTDKSDLSIEALEKVMLNDQNQGKASNLLNQIDPSLQENTDYINEVSKFMQQNPDLSESEVIDSIKEALEEAKPKEAVKKVKSASKKLQSKINKGKKAPSNEVEDDDLNDDIIDFGDTYL